ncbi:MAG: chromate resistance protein [Deltaproteobacteria bacterium]|nr:chromate resistance protein [Deltaproteobacteria bacterium]
MAARYVTWKGFEADKLACIWLIKRHIDHDATFVFLASGTKPASGIPFDMPDGDLRRRPDRSSFEVMLSYYRLNDPRLEKIALFIHDIEINTWEKKKYRQSENIRRFVSTLLSEKKKPQEIIDAALPFFDQLYLNP